MIRLDRVMTGFPQVDKPFDEWADAIERASRLKGVEPIFVSNTPSGPSVSVVLPRKFFVKLTGGGTLGAYTAVQVMPSATGGWATFPSGWTGTAYEYNQTATLPVDGSHRVEVTYFGLSNDFRFQSGTC